MRAVQDVSLVEAAARAGLRSLFVGFESLNQSALRRHRKAHNTLREYDAAVRILHDHGVAINASFIFGLDSDDQTVFDATVEWAIESGIETATFHILTPYPGTPLYERYLREGRILHRDWDLYDTRHAVFEHPRLTRAELEEGYHRAYATFYRWGSIVRGASHQPNVLGALRHVAYASAWKKVDPLWNVLITLKRLGAATPALETVLAMTQNRSQRVIETPTTTARAVHRMQSPRSRATKG